MGIKKANINTIIGAIFPISKFHINRFLKDKKTIFVKFTRFRRLEKGSKIIFYASGEKLLIGEGTIENIEVLDVKTAWKLYSQQIFLTEEEYEGYVTMSPTTGENRKANCITLFTLKNLKAFRTPTEFAKPITPSGCYVTKEEYESQLKAKHV
ncbi:MAG: DUF365 domain-containing protein [Candidatus Bathyarchaeia archaeon]